MHSARRGLWVEWLSRAVRLEVVAVSMQHWNMWAHVAPLQHSAGEAGWSPEKRRLYEFVTRSFLACACSVLPGCSCTAACRDFSCVAAYLYFLTGTFLDYSNPSLVWRVTCPSCRDVSVLQELLSACCWV